MLGWQAFYAVEPFGFFRDDFRSAQIAYWIVKANFKSPPQLSDFMFTTRGKKAEAMDDDELKSAMFAWGARSNGNNNRQTRSSS